MVLKDFGRGMTLMLSYVKDDNEKCNYILVYNKNYDQKLPDALALAGFSMFGLTILFLYQSRDKKLMYVM